MNLIGWMSALGQDLRFGARLLARSPGFTAAAVACLAIGLGVTASVFSEFQSLMFRDLPAVRAPGRAGAFPDAHALRRLGGVSRPHRCVPSLAAFLGPVPFEIATGGRPAERVWGQLVTPNYFRTLGVEPLAGRLFGVEEERAGAASVAVVERALWREHFGGSPRPWGGTIRVNGEPVTLIGRGAGELSGSVADALRRGSLDSGHSAARRCAGAEPACATGKPRLSI